MKKIRIYCMGYKGFKCIESLTRSKKNNLEISVIFSNDKTVQKDYYDEAKALCKKFKIPFSNRIEVQSENVKFDYIIAISWRWIIKENNVIVFHDSLLPKYRGFAPLVNCLINGERKTGVTAIMANNEYDRGDIISQVSLNIKYPIKIEKAIEQITFCYIKILNQLVIKFNSNTELEKKKQIEKKASYSLWLDEKDYYIDWNKSAKEIRRFIDSVGYPYNGALSSIDGIKVRVLDAKELPDLQIENRHPGKVIFLRNDKPIVVCGKGLLLIETLIDDSNNKNLLPLKKFRTKFISYV